MILLFATAWGWTLDGQPAVAQQAKPVDIDSDPNRPFGRRFDAPDFGRGTTWLNTGGPLRKRDLRGKFVLIDFWTYCCINCIHIMPTLQKVEEAWPNELVVIGVHSAKFDTEKDDENIIEAILRYEIRHPVINDKDHRLWDAFGVRSWPTLMILDPTGKLIWAHQGEVSHKELEETLQKFIKYYDARGLIDRTPLHIELAEYKQEETPLRFPGKIVADEKSSRLFVADSNHNRIVISDLQGKLIDIVGAGTIGKEDGTFETATFDHPQGMAVADDMLYVADTENHLIRKVDLKARSISTIAGTGEQARSGFPGYDRLKVGDDFPDRWIGKPLETKIASPWDLLVRGEDLFIAMAGPHQIWKMKIDESEIGPYAGSGREDIIDGRLLPKKPYAGGYSAFAQPSGLTSDEDWLYVADSEGSSIRAVPFDPNKRVKTVIGTAHLPVNRLFTFGDIDGKARTARLQHALGVAWKDGEIFVVDTYNNKIKVVNAETGRVKTLAGDRDSGTADDPARFDEPAGISIAGNTLFIADTNNHLIRTIDLDTQKVSTLNIAGLKPPEREQAAKQPSFASAKKIEVEPSTVLAVDDQIKVNLKFRLDTGWKLNPLVKTRVYVDVEADGAVVDKLKLKEVYEIESTDRGVEFSLPVTGEGTESVSIKVIFYYCQQGGEGLCKVGSVVWQVPLAVTGESDNDALDLRIDVSEANSNRSPFFNP